MIVFVSAFAVSVWACETAEPTPVEPTPQPPPTAAPIVQVEPTVKPTLEPTTTPTPTPSSTPTPTQTRTLDPSPTSTHVPTNTPEPTATTTGTPVPTQTQTPTVVAPTPMPTNTPTNTPEPTETPFPTVTSEPEPTPTLEPTPTPTAEPTVTSTPIAEILVEDEEPTVDDETLWGEYFETLDEIEVSCIHSALDEDDYHEMLERKVVSGQRVADRHELEIWGCLSQENAVDLYLSAFYTFKPVGDRTYDELAEIDACHRSLLQYVDFARYFAYSATNIGVTNDGFYVPRSLRFMRDSLVGCSLHDQSEEISYGTVPVYEARPINFVPDDRPFWQYAVDGILEEERDCIRNEIGSDGYEALLTQAVFDGKTEASDVAIWGCLGKVSAINVLRWTDAFDFLGLYSFGDGSSVAWERGSVMEDKPCIDHLLHRMDFLRLIKAGLPDVDLEDYRHGVAAIIGFGLCFGLPSVVEIDDHSDRLEGATEIAIGSFIEGNVDLKFDSILYKEFLARLDRDVFRFIAVPDLVYELDFSYGNWGPIEPPIDEQPIVRIQVGNLNDGRRFRIFKPVRPVLWEPSSSGVHYLFVDGIGPMPYQFEISISDYVDDFGSDFETATEMPIGGMVEGTIRQVNELDYFSFLAEAGVSYQLDVTSNDYFDPDQRSGALTVTLIDTDRNPIGEISHRRVWQAPSSGEFFLQVSGSQQSAYSISVSESSYRDDYGDNPGSATEITLGGNASGSLGTDIDEDYFYFDGVSGQAYEMNIETEIEGALYFDLVDTEGESISREQSRLIWQATDEGRYFIRIWGEEIGDYTLLLNGSDYADDHRNNEATVVLIGQPVEGYILNSSDLDAFSFVGVAGQAYDIGVEFGTLDDVVMQLYDSQGTWLGRFDEGRFTWQAWESGNYFVYLWSSGEGTYTFTVSSSDYQDDHGDDEEHATVLEFGETVPGVIGFDAGYFWYWVVRSDGDPDMFSFVAERGQVYQIDINLGSLLRSRFKLLDTTGDIQEVADMHLVWKAARSGKHYLLVSGLGVGDYELTVDRFEYSNDHGNDLSSATSIEVGETLSGDIRFEDERDFFRFTSTEGEAYQIDLVPKGLPFAKMSLLDADGTELGSDPSQLFARAVASKDFYIVVSPQLSTVENPLLSSSLATGEYTLSIKLLE